MDIKLLSDNFSQIIFELHNCYPDDEKGSEKRMAILEKILKYYVPIWTHYNNIGKLLVGIDNECGLTFCHSIEITYLRRDLLPKDSKKSRDSSKSYTRSK